MHEICCGGGEPLELCFLLYPGSLGRYGSNGLARGQDATGLRRGLAIKASFSSEALRAIDLA